MARKFIAEFKGDYRVQYWKPRDEDGKGGHNVYYFDDETEAKAKYVELVMRQAFGLMNLNRVVFEVLFDFSPSADDVKLSFCTILDSRKGCK